MKRSYSPAMAFAEKLLFVPPPIEVAGRRVKRYHVTHDPAGIAPEVEKAAYAMLPEILPSSTERRPRPSSCCTGAATAART